MKLKIQSRGLADCPVWASTFVHGHGCQEFARAEIKNSLRYDKGKTSGRFGVPATTITRVFIVIMQVARGSIVSKFSRLVPALATLVRLEKYGQRTVVRLRAEVGYSWFRNLAVFWMLCFFFWVITRRLNFIWRRFGTLCLFHLHRQVFFIPAYEDGTECSEMSAYEIQTPGNYPEESIQQT